MGDGIIGKLDARGIPVHVDAVEPVAPNQDILDQVSAAVVSQLRAVSSAIAGPGRIAKMLNPFRTNCSLQSRHTALPRSQNRRPNCSRTYRRKTRSPDRYRGTWRRTRPHSLHGLPDRNWPTNRY